MPIYAYRCASCGHAKDVLQKVSDAPLTVCPSCGAEAFQKQVTAAGFQLKGSGWYVTDFRGSSGGTAASAKPSDGGNSGGGGETKGGGSEGGSAPSGGGSPSSDSSGSSSAAAGGCGSSCACH